MLRRIIRKREIAENELIFTSGYTALNLGLSLIIYKRMNEKTINA